MIKGFKGNDNINVSNIWKYSNINELKLVNDEEPTEELFNDIIKEINKTDIYEKILDLDIKNKDRDKTINQLQDIIQNECNKIELRVEGSYYSDRNCIL